MVATKTEEKYQVKGSELMQKIKEILKAGNAKRISVIDKNGKTLLNIPLTFGVVGLVIAPLLAAIGTIAALVTECTITVEKKA